jgi:hypothetical protein
MRSRSGSPWLFLFFVLAFYHYQFKAAAFPLDAAATALACFEYTDEGERNNHFYLNVLDSLSNGNCMQYDEYRVAKNIYPQGKTFTAEELHCLSNTPELVACSASYLCHYYLYHDHSIAAYKSALLSLEYYPLAAPTVSCLSALYFQRKNFLRAAFYSSGIHLSFISSCLVQSC